MIFLSTFLPTPEASAECLYDLNTDWLESHQTHIIPQQGAVAGVFLSTPS